MAEYIVCVQCARYHPDTVECPVCLQEHRERMVNLGETQVQLLTEILAHLRGDIR